MIQNKRYDEEISIVRVRRDNNINNKNNEKEDLNHDGDILAAREEKNSWCE